MTPHATRLVTINGVRVKLILDEKQQVSVLRSLTGTTPTDTQVDGLSVPVGPLWLRLSVRALKWYRTKRAPGVGPECVYEPSCSRYAELALRQYGLRKGLYSTLKRLHRCRPGAGGVDLP
ncbi:membrane protein insertion efficiency factor YidD [Spirosoma fluviale]|uniref:Membrane-anchored protein YidD, putatitve component of membrane protein insertase Oxa1/YidC/SpoIIIJ n=1 Tax=Spirosoma fluviale TaxID=1597977 RepID=A0A286GQE1_9BACT|nr:membrane protein insertion efficiency factor YidD [Spirosoma fluviale]SOD97728.1 Membrane-anchored protein YidD, putatitve component of membrane protein insertase Oxa1/YidC/SpoIIIJ [Spirosoma fluviale]